jgi:hypothetical protein
VRSPPLWGSDAGATWRHVGWGVARRVANERWLSCRRLWEAWRSPALRRRVRGVTLKKKMQKKRGTGGEGGWLSTLSCMLMEHMCG